MGATRRALKPDEFEKIVRWQPSLTKRFNDQHVLPYDANENFIPKLDVPKMTAPYLIAWPNMPGHFPPPHKNITTTLSIGSLETERPESPNLNDSGEVNNNNNNENIDNTDNNDRNENENENENKNENENENENDNNNNNNNNNEPEDDIQILDDLKPSTSKKLTQAEINEVNIEMCKSKRHMTKPIAPLKARSNQDQMKKLFENISPSEVILIF